jgi:hypothetical protein
MNPEQRRQYEEICRMIHGTWTALNEATLKRNHELKRMLNDKHANLLILGKLYEAYCFNTIGEIQFTVEIKRMME